MSTLAHKPVSCGSQALLQPQGTITALGERVYYGYRPVSDSETLKLDALCESSIKMFTPQRLATAELADFC